MRCTKFKVVGIVFSIVLAFAAVLPCYTGSQTSGENVSEKDYYLVCFDALPSEADKQELTEMLALNFLEYHQANTYLVSLPTSLLQTLQSRPGVVSVIKYEANDKIDQDLARVTGEIKLRVNFHGDVDFSSAVERLASIGVTVTKTNTASVYFAECVADASLVNEIASLREVSWLQQQFEGEVLMNLISSNTYMGTDTPQLYGFSGSGILAEVQDNGIDIGHPDLAQVDYTDFPYIADDHGTCTSGIMFGNGAGDPNALGNLNQATGVFCDWMNGNALAIQHLWDGTFTSGNAGMNGVVQTNSWWNGATMDGQYDAMSNELDQAIVDYPHLLTHWACGNSNSGTGLGLMSAESISKNDMWVGAIFHMNTAAFSDDDWHNAGSGATPSRGPAADGRMKPDLIGPFDWIYTVDQRGAAGYTGTDYYDDFGGTSGATPNVAGCSGLAYEMYHENYFDNNPAGAWPYSCTIKALMIADAYQYPIGVNAIDRNVEGWGTPDMEKMYNLGAEYHVFEEYPQALNADESWGRYVYSDGVNPLKITLCWIDPAAPSTTLTGRSLINNLDLRVTSPGGTIYWGNNGLLSNLWSVSGTGVNDWSRSSSYTDDENNVENVFILAPQTGQWRIDVYGHSGDVSQGPQHFSVVASGAKSISQAGTISLDKTKYRLEDTAQVTVADTDLNSNPSGVETTSVIVSSTSEPTGESVTLTETGTDTSTFVGTVTLSATNGAGILWVSNANIVTATYNDANNGTGPATVTDTAIVDGAPPFPPTGLTVTWTGITQVTLASQDFTSATFPPTGWATQTSGTTGTWTRSTTANAGGTSPEAHFTYGASGTGTSRLYFGPVDTTGMTDLNLQFRQFYDAYGAGVTVKVQTSTNAVTWIDTGWSIVDSSSNVGPSLINEAISTAEGAGSATLYLAFVVDGNSWYLDNWYIDNVLLEYLAPNTNDNRLDWTLSSDDGGGADDVVKYVVYRSNLQAGPWDDAHVIANLTAGTNNYTDVGRGEFDGTNWWYVVRAEDDVGNRDTNTNAVPEIPTGNLPPSMPSNPNPANGQTGVSTSPDLSVSVSDPNGDAMDVYFYNAVGPALIGTDNGVPSGGTATVPWLGLAESTTYNWYAVADDSQATTQSPTWSFTTLDTMPPAPVTGLTVDWWGYASTYSLYTYSGVTQTGGPHDAWAYQADSMAVTGPACTDGRVEASDLNYTEITASNNVRWITVDPGTGDEMFIMSDFDVTQAPSLVTQITMVCEIQAAALTNFQLWAHDWIGNAWVQISTVNNVAMNTDAFVWGNITTNCANYVNSGNGTLEWGIYQSDSSDMVRVDHMYANLTYLEYSNLYDNTLNWTLSADDGAGANDVAQYNIYRSVNPMGPWDITTYVTSVPAGTATYLDQNRGQIDGIRWWYVVRAEDIYSNEEMNTNAVPEPGQDTFDIPVHIGWNLMSTPLPPMSSALPDIFLDQGGDTTWTCIQRYNASDISDPWKTWASFRPSTVNDMNFADHRTGVWLYIPDATALGDGIIRTTGTLPSSETIQLRAGWNLVGYPSLTPRSITNSLAGLPYTSVEGYNAANPYRIAVLPGSYMMTPGEAYWVQVSSDCVWTLNW
jgi:serine protease AprX